MVGTHWDDMRGRELRYDDHSWELTGDLEIRQSGDLLAVEARRTDGSKHGTATLYFSNGDPPNSLNPGSSEPNFDHLERDGDRIVLVIDAPGRRYRYELDSIEYE